MGATRPNGFGIEPTFWVRPENCLIFGRGSFARRSQHALLLLLLLMCVHVDTDGQPPFTSRQGVPTGRRSDERGLDKTTTDTNEHPQIYMKITIIIWRRIHNDDGSTIGAASGALIAPGGRNSTSHPA